MNYISFILNCIILFVSREVTLNNHVKYLKYVPVHMAFDSKGAYWISDSKSIQNPYMGSKMQTCGEVKEEL